MGKFPARGCTYSLPDEKTEKEEKKNKTRKTSNPGTFVEFPALSILFYHVALAESLLNVIIFVSEKY